MPFTKMVIVGWRGRRSDQRQAAPCMTSEPEEGITGADVPRPERTLGWRWDLPRRRSRMPSFLLLSANIPPSSPHPSSPLSTRLPSARLASVHSRGLIARRAACGTLKKPSAASEGSALRPQVVLLDGGPSLGPRGARRDSRRARDGAVTNVGNDKWVKPFFMFGLLGAKGGVFQKFSLARRRVAVGAQHTQL